MLGCNTVCPKCRHEFTCCRTLSATPCCVTNRRSLHALSGGGLISPNGTVATLAEDKSLLAPAFSPSSCRAAQISPSAPLAFVLPFPPTPAFTPTDSRPETELRRLSESVRMLRESGWYHEGLTWQQSQSLLKNTDPGTFLIRDSSDPRFLYALSVQTEHGPTSVRLHYVDGKFRLDSESYLAPLMPLFDTVLDLIRYYVQCSARNTAGADGAGRTGGQVWVDANGCMFSRILLRRPLLRADRVPGLQHLARLAVHRALEASARPRLALLPPPHTQLELPNRLVDYLADYPYSF